MIPGGPPDLFGYQCPLASEVHQYARQNAEDMAQYFWCAPRARASSPERGARGFRRSVHASRRAAPALRRYVRDTRGFDAFEAQEEIKASKKKSWFGQ